MEPTKTERFIKGLPASEYYKRWKQLNKDKVREQSLKGYHRNKETINRRLTLIKLKGGCNCRPETLQKYGINLLDHFGDIDD